MKSIEWPTLAVLCLCYGVFVCATTILAGLSLPLAIVVTGCAVTLHSSLQHEIIHGHPFANQSINEALVFPALGLWVPYGRFRDTHLAHHKDAVLTDPYDDPESQYLAAGAWAKMPALLRAVFRFNGTLAGRMAVGPLIGQVYFMAADWRAVKNGDRSVARAWLLHFAGVALVMAWVWHAAMPIWAYGIAAYLGSSILRIRVFIEHQAHEHTAGRTVVVEDRGFLAFLFLNNNFHAVHHMQPAVAWYKLPALYASSRDKVLERNQGYRYRSYWPVFAKYLFRSKEPVAHPLIK